MKTKTITVDGVDYAPVARGSRHIVVLDRGWVFVGDLVVVAGACRLTRVKNIRSWKSGGFGGMTRDPKGCSVAMDESADLTFTESAALFMVPVAETWGE